MMTLRKYGWNEKLQHAFNALADESLVPGRIITPHRGAFDVITESGEVVAELPGRSYFRAASPRDLPVVGDWVAVKLSTGNGSAGIHSLLPRRTLFMRKEPGRVAREQVIAANVDTVFIVSSMNMDFSPRRIERYLALIHESGARPVLVLSKCDLVRDPGDFLKGWGVPDVPIHQTSAKTGQGLEELRSYFDDNETVALVGSSGVGKSTLINSLLGEERQDVKDIREDGKGRHTTTRRELIPMTGGGAVLDTPGMRELQLFDAEDGVTEAFDDIEELGLSCKYSNCRHGTEPGCAVRAAVEGGTLPEHRLNTFRQFQTEVAFQKSRVDERVKAEEKRNVREADNKEYQREKRRKKTEP